MYRGEKDRFPGIQILGDYQTNRISRREKYEMRLQIRMVRNNGVMGQRELRIQCVGDGQHNA